MYMCTQPTVDRCTCLIPCGIRENQREPKRTNRSYTGSTANIVHSYTGTKDQIIMSCFILQLR